MPLLAVKLQHTPSVFHAVISVLTFDVLQGIDLPAEDHGCVVPKTFGDGQSETIEASHIEGAAIGDVQHVGVGDASISLRLTSGITAEDEQLVVVDVNACTRFVVEVVGNAYLRPLTLYSVKDLDALF